MMDKKEYELYLSACLALEHWNEFYPHDPEYRLIRNMIEKKIGGPTKNNKTCDHDKVYDQSVILTSYPPKIQWICRKCGECGYESLYDSPQYQNEYDMLIKKYQDEKK